MSELLKATEGAKVLNVGRTRMYELAANGGPIEDAVVRLGAKSIRFRADRLQAFIDRGGVPAAGENTDAESGEGNSK